MRIITKKRLREFTERYLDAAEPLNNWRGVIRAARWRNIQDCRRIYPHADLVKVASGNAVTVFNIGGNKYRLVVAIHYNRQRVYVLRCLRHAEYSKGRWKMEL